MSLLRFSFENFEEVRARFDPVIVKKAVNSTIPRVARRARTFVSKEMRKIYTVKAGTIKDQVTLRTQKQTESTIAILSYAGGPLPIDRFSTTRKTVQTNRGPRRAVTAKVKRAGGRKLVRGGFPLRGETGPTMERTGSDRLPIKRVFSVSVPQMLTDDIYRASINQVEKDANVELNRNLTFFQDRASRRR